MNKSTLTLLLLTLLLPLLSNAQGWEKTYEGGFDERTQAADRTLDGGVIMTGTQINNNTDLQLPFIYKMDADGNLQWELYKTESEDDFVSVHEIISLSDGNLILAFATSSIGQSASEEKIQKLDQSGNVIWSKDISVDSLGWVRDIKETPSGEIIISGGYSPNGLQGTSILKLDEGGNIIWIHSFDEPLLPYWPGDVVLCSDGGAILLGYLGFGNADQNAYAKKIDGNGNILWEQEYVKPDAQFAISGYELANGEFLVGGMSSININIYDAALFKLDANGNEIWFQVYEEPIGSENIISLRSMPDGNIVMAGTATGMGAGEEDLYLMKLDTAGNQLWTNTFGRSKTESLGDVMVTDDNEFYLAGYTQKSDNSYDAYLVKTDSLGNSYTNELSGNLYHDQNIDCIPDPNEDGLQQWFLKAAKGDLEYFTITDTLGDYSMTLDTGVYDITVSPISPLWDICDANFTVDFTNSFDTISENIAAQAIFDCPYLEVSIGTPFLRRCFENTYTVQYCNYGTTTAEDAYVEVILDPFMQFLDSSIPVDTQNGDTLSFLVDDLNIGDCGYFTFDIFLLEAGAPCDSLALGETHCVEAHIYPDSLCETPNNWSGASIEVDAICYEDSISFFIENVGTAPTAPNLEYFVIEDDVILYEGTFSLDVGGTETFTVLTDGSTFRMEAEQEPNHPGMSMPSVSVEGCGDGNLTFSFGFVNIFSQDDGNPFVDIDCRTNIGAYDPNDKTGFPLGYGEEHYINRGQDIEYLVRFQNTGTDTAFNVVIRDKLSEYLDLTTVRPGTSSHPYNFDLAPDGELVFTFENIMLPDSNINEVASHGFVEFKVAQQPNLALETQIYNSAGIYFDFNAPVITNQTLHTIGENYITVSIDPIDDPQADVKVYPNPFTTSTRIEIEGLDIKNGAFKLYDVTGRLLRIAHFDNNNFVFEKNDLLSGMYFFTIENEGALIASGKIVAQ